jgi:hypothetical protein
MFWANHDCTDTAGRTRVRICVLTDGFDGAGERSAPKSEQIAVPPESEQRAFRLARRRAGVQYPRAWCEASVAPYRAVQFRREAENLSRG